ncbi:hypothetical protein [Cellulosimicrobium sp. Marseille-Q4280]|uniref:hypothetical protein n=1 Tax=Cellulosimicrobium sp. Marseille-Q4280 TaxID=2937992 RepID=UPI00203EE7D7|nr:hypothetical protein [Cellulosimicrobium sp. Marseille-Q4280]
MSNEQPSAPSVEEVRQTRAAVQSAVAHADAEEIFDAFGQLAAIVARSGQARRAARRDARNAAARARYARRKAAGTLPQRGKARAAAAVQVERDDVIGEHEHGCACANPGVAAPCWHCTDCPDCWG